MKKICSIFIVIVVMVSSVGTASALVSAGGRALVETVAEYLGRVEAREFARAGGEMALREALETAERRGGRVLAGEAADLITRYGSRTIRAISRDPEVMVPAIKRLPVTLGKRAVDVINRSPEAALTLVRKYGDDAVEVLARHRGTGELLIEKFGADGIRLGKALPEEMGIKVLQEGRDITKLTASTRKKVVDYILKMPDKIASYIERHPKAMILGAVIYYFPELTDTVVKETGKTVKTLMGTDERRVTYTTPDGREVVEINRRGLFEIKDPGFIGYAVIILIALVSIYLLVKTATFLRRKKA